MLKAQVGGFGSVQASGLQTARADPSPLAGMCPHESQEAEQGSVPGVSWSAPSRTVNGVWTVNKHQRYICVSGSVSS